MADSRSLTEEALAVVRRAFEPGPLSFRGRHFHFENLEVVPRVIQQPHPPLWTAAVSPESF
jgi:alkanesulfonate monooxygenase SsuD/methylene tetrahydromethanopterin reductase-like flavin-dependent oxidoreductase (luciferase family)